MKGSGLGYAILAVVMLILYGIAMILRGIVSSIVNWGVMHEANRASRNTPPSTTTNPTPTGWQLPPNWRRPLDGSTHGTRPPTLADTEPDVLCTYCTQQFHDGGKRCIRCGSFTRSRLYCICHECGCGRKNGGWKCCESCGTQL